MKTIENDCVDCAIPCIDCGRKRTVHYYCDKCGEEASVLYEFDNDELCKDCLIEEIFNSNEYKIVE